MPHHLRPVTAEPQTKALPVREGRGEMPASREAKRLRPQLEGRGNRVHCIGIGGIGLSALARWYKAHGWKVSGSDAARSEITDALRREGMRVFIGHCRVNLDPAVRLVLHTNAIPRKNPELLEAEKRGIQTLTYAQALGELTATHQTICVAGAHGKSTTTALVSLVLAANKLDPTVIVGTKLREFGDSNFRLGRSGILVVEADEYRASFLNYTPIIAVVTNIDREHLDFYKNIGAVKRAFQSFLARIRTGGIAILNRDDPRLGAIGRALARKGRVRVVWYSLRDPHAKMIAKVLRIPGQHNVSNALAAFAVGRAFGIPRAKILRALAAYRGAWRRFDYQGRVAGASVFADYAHHPTEIRATLAAARAKFPQSRLWCVFQPHHYERTRLLFSDFAKAFDDCNGLILLDIYEVAGRERKNRSPRVNSAALAQAARRRGVNASYLADPSKLSAFLGAYLGRRDVLVMMGAGSIWEMTKELMRSKIRNQRPKTLRRTPLSSPSSAGVHRAYLDSIETRIRRPFLHGLPAVAS